MNRNPPPYDATPADPIAVVAPHLPRAPQRLVVAGLGDGNEAQCAVRRWPSLKVIGVDPDPRAVEYQRTHDWPTRNGTMFNVALSCREGRGNIFMDSLNCPSMHPLNLASAPWQKVLPVTTTTLDALDQMYGPFEDCLLWLDVEGWEYMALAGAHHLLDSGRVMAVNWERRIENEASSCRHVARLLERYDFRPALTWGRQWWGHDELWVKE